MIDSSLQSLKNIYSSEAIIQLSAGMKTRTLISPELMVQTVKLTRMSCSYMEALNTNHVY